MEIILENICKSYGDKAVIKDFSHRFLPERAYCLFGPSGCGKTTLMRLIAGLEAPDSGTISGVKGKKISAVFQEDRLFENLSAQKNVLLTAAPAFDGASARALLAELGLEENVRKPVREFSGGMRRRVALARALAADWDLLLLDEPFAGLDESSRHRAISVLSRHIRSRLVLLITHEKTDAQLLGAQIIPLNP